MCAQITDLTLTCKDVWQFHEMVLMVSNWERAVLIAPCYYLSVRYPSHSYSWWPKSILKSSGALKKPREHLRRERTCTIYRWVLTGGQRNWPRGELTVTSNAQRQFWRLASNAYYIRNTSLLWLWKNAHTCQVEKVSLKRRYKSYARVKEIIKKDKQMHAL